MEEDIKILEEYIKHDTDLVNLPEYDAKIVYKAIENLIARYKELEEENEQLEAIKNEAIRRYNFESIPKSKVKDKIEELKKKVEELTDEKGYWGGSDLLEQIQVLQDLLGKE